MWIRVYALNDNEESAFLAEAQVDPLRLMIMAESRQDIARKKGADWTAGAIPFFAQELIAAVQAKKPQKELEMQATNAALAAWLFDSLYGGITDETFMKSHLNFTILPGGAVKYQRVPAATH